MGKRTDWMRALNPPFILNPWLLLLMGVSLASAEDRHWAFQPVIEPPVPALGDWGRQPVDAFILEKLTAAGLAPSPEADRATLIRRVSYTLTGLPPTPEAVAGFLADGDYEQMVDRYLDSPHYGEQWARHWLDVARYSDTKGYVYAREERFWPHAWAYRDWVTAALNEDLPYDRFLLLQLAADQVTDRRETDAAAMGFLTLGRRFLGVRHDVIDDRIDVVTRGTMGLTVSCARCHDHKYDPIPTADYYSLYGIFDSCTERLRPVAEKSTGDEAFWKTYREQETKLREAMAKRRDEAAKRVRGRVGDYLQAQTELEKYPADGFDQIFGAADLLPAFVRKWEEYLRQAELRDDPVFRPWHAYRKSISATAPKTGIAEVDAAFATPPKDFADVIQRYAALFKDPKAEALQQVLTGPDSPCVVPDEPIVRNETYFDSGATTELWKLQGDLDRAIIKSKLNVPFALLLEDLPQPVTPRVFLRGSPLVKGEETPRQFLSVLAGAERKPFAKGSGRLELAQSIIDAKNPLTARVIVNRVWAHHFGRGLVPTPSDFGVRADLPSHPALLDWLAARFVAEGWSLKNLHRWMLLSATFRQSSLGTGTARAMELDPANRLLWRMNPQRLSYEEFRDSMLAAAGRLDLAMGGKPADLFAKPFPTRRAIYGLVDRQFLPGALRMFDFANPDLHIPQRLETTVPQQALFFMNHPLVLEQSRHLAKVSQATKDPVREMFRRALQREPSALEHAEALAMIGAAGNLTLPAPPVTSADWQYGYGAVDEANQRVKGFKLLPHFTGESWQGGAAWPDKELGWVQLTAEGGHPGNDRNHAAVRRWTAPKAMLVRIQSTLVHEPKAGDGIRAFVISSRAGKLQEAKVKAQTIDLTVSTLEVAAAETLDFVVDIGDVLNSDQFLWNISLSSGDPEDPAFPWNSRNDFSPNTVQPLTAWEQLAQTLLCSNEFLFVD